MSRPLAVSIVIPTFNKVDYTLACLQSLVTHTAEGAYEVVVVDNGSTDATRELLGALEGDVQVVLNDENAGFAHACNQGASVGRGRHVLFLNNDTEVTPGWLEPLVDVLDREADVGAVGNRLVFPDGSIQHAGVDIVEHVGRRHQPGGQTFYGTHRWYGEPAGLRAASVRRDCQAVTAACMAVRREAFDGAGGFDEGYWNGNEDVDLCLSMGAAGWRVVYEPASVVVHHESASGPERWSGVQRNVDRLVERWRGRVRPDIALPA